MRIDVEIKNAKLPFFQELYSEALSESDELYTRLERHYRQYKGSAEIDGSEVKAKQVRNITYELIESQVTGYLPNPSVSPKMHSDKNERNARSVETMLRNKRDELPFEVLNDMDERYSPIYGGSVWLVEWDDSIVTHNTVGDIKLSCLSPRRFFGQPNIYRIDDMEYCFIDFETTKEDIERRYGVRTEVAEEAESDDSADDKTATLHVCYYKNEEDKVCQYIWSGDTELLDVEDYFSRKRRICKKCGKREELCRCDKPDLELQNEEFEEIERDIYLSDGTIIPSMSEVIRDGQVVTRTEMHPIVDEVGNMILEDIGNGVLAPAMGEVQVPKMEKTKLPFYAPTKFPIVIRKNTSEEDNLLGQSDCEFIRPQQQAINKLESRIQEKLIKGGVYPIVPKDFEGTLKNSIFEDAFRAGPEDYSRFGTIDLQANTSQDTAHSERLYDQAKRILGITDSFQGQYDASAQSGKAKQIQVQQAAGRLDSKRQMKNSAYAEIDQIIFQLYLAYADEPRPAAYRDADGTMQNRIFNRYDFLERDEAGEWYYNDQYLFHTDATLDVDKQRETLWQENRYNFQQGAYGDPALPQTKFIFWRVMERLHYPWANDIVEFMRGEMMQQQAAMQEQLVAMQQRAAQLQGELQNRAGYEQYLTGKIQELNGGISNGNNA